MGGRAPSGALEERSASRHDARCGSAAATIVVDDREEIGDARQWRRKQVAEGVAPAPPTMRVQ
jgi:hypothetical protein